MLLGYKQKSGQKQVHGHELRAEAEPEANTTGHQSVPASGTCSLEVAWSQVETLVLRLLLQRVAPIFQEKGFDFHVDYIQAVRNWKAALPDVAELSGAYRKRSKDDVKVIPHSFTFLQRSRYLSQDRAIVDFQSSWKLVFSPSLGMLSTLLEEAKQRLPRRFQQRSNDIFCLVKAFVSDHGLSQPALLVLPGDTVEEVVSPALAAIADADCPRTLLNIKFYG